MLKTLGAFVRKEAVLSIAALCAVITCFFVPPDAMYPEYIDLRVLCLLLCLMAVVAGAEKCGVFGCLTWKLLKNGGSGRILSLILVMLPFFSSMLVTNDVALLIFVPFTMPLLCQIGCERKMIPILVLQTVAANLGSMATPVGNPQNLYLYASYHLGAGDFFGIMLPLTAISLVFLAAVSIPLLPKTLPELHLEKVSLTSPMKLLGYGLMFLLCLLTVFRMIPYGITTIVVLVFLFLADRSQLKHLDFALLMTFVCFFIVSGNLGRLEVIRNFLQRLLEANPLLTAVGASQIISNVPAAVLLSEFTQQWSQLLMGVNIGGLGTPIASLASLITLKLYLRREGAFLKKYLGVFTLVNVIGLVILLAAVSLMII